MKRFIFGGILFITGSISSAILLLAVPISSILFGTSINDSSSIFTYLGQLELVPIFIIFILIAIVGLFFLISELLKGD